MSAQQPPIPPWFPGYIFNPLEFIDEAVTGSSAALLYLKKAGDIATGYMTWSAGFLSAGISTMTANLVFSGSAILSQSGTGQNILKGTIINGQAYVQDFAGPAQFQITDLSNGTIQTFSQNNTTATWYNGGVGGTSTFQLKDGSGVIQNVITTSTNTINFNTVNPMTSSATMPGNTDNSTKIPTTAWVQSAISGSTGLAQRYAWGNSVIGTGGASAFNVSIVFPTGTSWNVNEKLTLRCRLNGDWCLSSNASFPVSSAFYDTTFDIDVFPSRLFNSTFTNNLPTNVINNSSSYVYSDPTYAPNGRWFWVSNYVSQYTPDNNAYAVNPLYFTCAISGSQTTFTMSFQKLVISGAPSSSSGSQTFYMSVLQNGQSGQSFSSSGITSFTNNYANF